MALNDLEPRIRIIESRPEDPLIPVKELSDETYVEHEYFLSILLTANKFRLHHV